MADKLYKVSLDVFVEAESKEEALLIGKEDLKEALEGNHMSAVVNVEEVDTEDED